MPFLLSNKAFFFSFAFLIFLFFYALLDASGMRKRVFACAAARRMREEKDAAGRGSLSARPDGRSPRAASSASFGGSNARVLRPVMPAFAAVRLVPGRTALTSGVLCIIMEADNV